MTIQEELNATIADLVQPGKGILAADESSPTIAKRFKAVGVESTEATRRDSLRRNPGTAGQANLKTPMQRRRP